MVLATCEQLPMLVIGPVQIWSGGRVVTLQGRCNSRPSRIVRSGPFFGATVATDQAGDSRNAKRLHTLMCEPNLKVIRIFDFNSTLGKLIVLQMLIMRT